MTYDNAAYRFGPLTRLSEAFWTDRTPANGANHAVNPGSERCGSAPSPGRPGAATAASMLPTVAFRFPFHEHRILGTARPETKAYKESH
ncbi:hypothetical protein GCM10028833_01700 [Glycomyces tarimensis]